MRALKFFFPIAFRLSDNGGKLAVGIIIHAVILTLYFLISVALFLLSLPLWILLFFIPILGVVFVVVFVVFLFVAFVIDIVIPFYCIGGILLGILNYRKILAVLEDKPLNC